MVSTYGAVSAMLRVEEAAANQDAIVNVIVHDVEGKPPILYGEGMAV